MAMQFPEGAEQIIQAADLWYQGARSIPRTGLLSKVEARHPIMTTWTSKEAGVARWYDACTTAFVLCAMRSSSELLEARESGIARLALVDLYKNDFPEGFLLVDATLSTEEWMQSLRRDLAYGVWILCTVSGSSLPLPDEQEEERIELTATLGAMVTNFADAWWSK